MSSPFNTYLRGLLGLLDAKVGGRAPDRFEDALQLGLDAMPFILAQRRESLLGTTATFTTVGMKFDAAAIHLVPSDEVWYVDHYCGVQVGTLVAAEFLAYQPSIRTQATSGVSTTESTGDNPYVYGVGDRPAVTMQRPLIAIPGDQLGMYVSRATTAASFQLNIVASVIRFKV